MPYTYPPAAPTISGDNVTISRFLNNPTLVARRLRTLLEQRYIADTPEGRAELAAAALYLAADQLDKVKDEAGAAAIRQEISRQYEHTQVANQRRTGGK